MSIGRTESGLGRAFHHVALVVSGIEPIGGCLSSGQAVILWVSLSGWSIKRIPQLSNVKISHTLMDWSLKMQSLR